MLLLPALDRTCRTCFLLFVNCCGFCCYACCLTSGLLTNGNMTQTRIPSLLLTLFHPLSHPLSLSNNQKKKKMRWWIIKESHKQISQANGNSQPSHLPQPAWQILTILYFANTQKRPHHARRVSTRRFKPEDFTLTSLSKRMSYLAVTGQHNSATTTSLFIYKYQGGIPELITKATNIVRVTCALVFESWIHHT